MKVRVITNDWDDGLNGKVFDAEHLIEGKSINIFSRKKGFEYDWSLFNDSDIWEVVEK